MAVLARLSFFLAVFCIVSQDSVVHSALPTSISALQPSFNILSRGLCGPTSPLPTLCTGAGTQAPLSPAALQQIMSTIQATLNSLLGTGTTLPGGLVTPPALPGVVTPAAGGVAGATTAAAGGVAGATTAAAGGAAGATTAAGGAAGATTVAGGNGRR